MCYCDENPPEFHSKKIVTGRKPHKCVECLRAIETGEQHEYAVGKWDGCFDQIRTCMECVSLRTELNPECYVYGGLIDEVSDMDAWACTESVREFKSRFKSNYSRTKKAVS